MFFRLFSLWAFARIHFELKLTKPNEVDWFEKVIRINSLIFLYQLILNAEWISPMAYWN